MQFKESLVPLFGLILGVSITSMLLGVVLRHHTSTIFESSLIARIGFLIGLAVAVGIVLFYWFIFGWTILLFAAPISLCLGTILIFGPRE